MENNELESTDAGLSYEGDNLSYGAGVSLRLSRRLGARLEWKRLEMEIGEWNADYDAFLLGVKINL